MVTTLANCGHQPGDPVHETVVEQLVWTIWWAAVEEEPRLARSTATDDPFCRGKMTALLDLCVDRLELKVWV